MILYSDKVWKAKRRADRGLYRSRWSSNVFSSNGSTKLNIEELEVDKESYMLF